LVHQEYWKQNRSCRPLVRVGIRWPSSVNRICVWSVKLFVSGSDETAIGFLIYLCDNKCSSFILCISVKSMVDTCIEPCYITNMNTIIKFIIMLVFIVWASIAGANLLALRFTPNSTCLDRAQPVMYALAWPLWHILDIDTLDQFVNRTRAICQFSSSLPYR